MAKCMGKQSPIEEIDSYKDSHFDEWAKEIVYRQGWDRCAENSKESCVNEREEEYVMGQVDEIGRVADN